MGKAESFAAEVLEKPLTEILGEKYLAYALSTIVSRSLPDVRDGLKPVHRRLLFAMRRLSLASTTMPKKSARVIGDVIGKYHPHGEASVYDALVRLAQDFAVRYTLVDGQGNFGNIDGDSAAAMRYTEARLTAIAEALLDGIDEDSVDFRDNYDGSELEPVVLPAAFPNLLANGAQGIAVGMATAIPPHNVGELCLALKILLENPQASLDEILAVLPAPDFPTGGVLVETPASMREAYATGKGGFRLRAAWHKEELKQGMWQIIVTEIPWQVPKSRLIEDLANQLEAKKLPLLEDVRDESAEDVRLVLVPRNRTVDAELLMESLFRASALESRIPLNMNVLDRGIAPRVMALPEVLQAFLAHRFEVMVRRANFRLGKIAQRLEILGGMLIVYLDLDKVIQIIREEDEPKTVLIAHFALTEIQAEAILNTRLRSLRKLEEMELRREKDTLEKEQQELLALTALDDKGEKKRRGRLKAELDETIRKFGDARRTLLAVKPEIADVPMEALIEREPITILLSEKGWIRALKGHVTDTSDVKYKDGDAARFALQAETPDKLVLVCSDGRCFTLGCDKLPGGRGFGEPVRLSLDIGNDVTILSCFLAKAGQKRLMASNDGRGFIVDEAELVSSTRGGKQVLVLDESNKPLCCLPITGDHLAVIGDNRKLLVFPVAELPEMSRGKGVMLQKYRDGGLSDVCCVRLETGLSWRVGEREKTEKDLLPWLGKRAQAGRLPPNGFPKNNKFNL